MISLLVLQARLCHRWRMKNDKVLYISLHIVLIFIYLLIIHVIQFSSVRFSSVAQSCPPLCDPMNRSTPGLPVHHQLPSSLRFMSIESVMLSSHLILCHPLLLLPLIFPSIRVFSNEKLFAFSLVLFHRLM